MMSGSIANKITMPTRPHRWPPSTEPGTAVTGRHPARPLPRGRTDLTQTDQSVIPTQQRSRKPDRTRPLGYFGQHRL